MFDRGHEGALQRAILRPARKEFEDPRVVEFRVAIASLGDRQFLPLHAGVEHSEDRVEGLMIADLALGPASRQGQMGQDKLCELFCAHLYGNSGGIGLGRRLRVNSCHVITSCDDPRENRSTSYPYRTLAIS